MNDDLVRRQSHVESSFKNSLNRLYFSSHIQFIYLFLIALSLFDLIWTLATWKNYLDIKWQLVLSLVLNFIVLGDSICRIYILTLARFCECRSNWIEIVVLVVSVPDVIILIVFLAISGPTSSDIQLFTLLYSTLVLVLRPIVLCKRQTKSKVSSIHLPNTIIYSEPEAAAIREQSRFDSLCDCTSYDIKKSLESSPH